MSPKNLDDRPQEPKINSQLQSSIVHKPFATGTVNIFNPYRPRGQKANSQLAAPKLYLNAELEKAELAKTESLSVAELEPEPPEIAYCESNWFDRCLNPWSITAIAIIFLANLVSGAVIWRNARGVAPQAEAQSNNLTLGNIDLATEEFIPLNLSTLSRLPAVEADESRVIEPIAPALAPINLAQSHSSPEYYYILTEYRGDDSLARVRQKVERVSLVNLPQGVFIYLGAYKDRDEAELFVTHLEQLNLTAQIYPFE
ncbi:MAG: hypothetical protein AAFQ41_07895 [Cyanobacteria bacterium J06623_7]